MAEQQNPQDQVQFLLSDFNTRLRDSDERSRLIRERVLLLGKNLIDARQDLEEELKEIKRENREIKEELEKMRRVLNNVTTEVSKFIKRDEMVLIERMLKDFQPLEFMRKKDVEKLIEEKLEKSKKQIKTTKS
jgi:hypothetical protein